MALTVGCYARRYSRAFRRRRTRQSDSKRSRTAWQLFPKRQRSSSIEANHPTGRRPQAVVLPLHLPQAPGRLCGAAVGSACAATTAAARKATTKPAVTAVPAVMMTTMSSTAPSQGPAAHAASQPACQQPASQQPAWASPDQPAERAVW